MRGAGLAAVAAAVALATAGCGGDDEKAGDGGAGTDSARTEQTVPADAVTDPATVPEKTTTVPARGRGKGKSPEKQPGGAGDEKGNSAQALITGRSGKLSPGTVKVPAYIAVTVELRSADGLDYGLAGVGKRLDAGEGANSDTARFAGLRPGKSLVLVGPQGKVVISATADPGP
jgi:hypothetical protein